MTLALKLLSFLSSKYSRKIADSDEATLVANPFAQLDSQADPLISPEVLEIYRWVDQNLVDRPDEANVLRASAAPLCVRRRWLQRNRIAGRRMAPRSITNFILGDLFEHSIKWLIKQSLVGPTKLYSEVHFGTPSGTFPIQHREIEKYDQVPVITKIGDLEIPGHFDGVGLRNADGNWEYIEAKSASDYMFNRSRSVGPGEVLKQAHTLMMSDHAKEFGITSTRYFYGRKQSGHLHTRLAPFDQRIAATVEREFAATVAQEIPSPPHSLAREFKKGIPTGRLVALSFPCSMCPYINTPNCHNGLEKTLKKDHWGHQKTVYSIDLRKAIR